jgi:hypothetical protein
LGFHACRRAAPPERSLAAFDVVGRLLHQRLGRDGAAVGRFVVLVRQARRALADESRVAKWTDPEGAPRGGMPGAAPKNTLANVPPILASPPASNRIAFSGNVLTIPDRVRTGLQSVGPAHGKTLASYEKMSERDVEDAIDKRMRRIRHDATRASTSEHSRS